MCSLLALPISPFLPRICACKSRRNSGRTAIGKERCPYEFVLRVAMGFFIQVSICREGEERSRVVTSHGEGSLKYQRKPVGATLFRSEPTMLPLWCRVPRGSWTYCRPLGRCPT